MDNYSVSSDEDSASDVETFGSPGMFIEKRYLLINEIGSGAFSIVWLAYDIQTDSLVVAKIQNADDYETGIEEVNILNKINKLNTKFFTRILDYFEHDFENGTCVVLIFELMAGSLGDIMVQDVRYSKGFSPKVLKCVCNNIAKGIDILNKKLDLCHTDIKPENILVEGVSLRIEEIVKKFKSFNFKDKLKKNKMRRKHSNYETYTIKRLMAHMGNLMNEERSTNSSESDDSENSDSSDSESEKEEYKEFLDKKYIEDIKVRLADFGNCKKNGITEEIQTRYYRAPEVILEMEPYDFKSDIWSLGCTLYELATGEILFDPDRYRGMTRDRDHIYLIVKTFGPIDKTLLKKSTKYHIFFTKEGLLKRRDKIDYLPLREKIFNKLSQNPLWDNDTIEQFIDLLTNLLTIDPEKRMDLNLISQHPFICKKTCSNSKIDLNTTMA